MSSNRDGGIGIGSGCGCSCGGGGDGIGIRGVCDQVLPTNSHKFPLRFERLHSTFTHHVIQFSTMATITLINYLEKRNTRTQNHPNEMKKNKRYFLVCSLQA